jgi:hypothetical protein
MSLYLPGAKIIPGRDGGLLLGGPAKVVWHTTENDPTQTTATNVANYLVGSGDTVHLVWNPVSGETVAMLPANLAGRGLENRAGGVETNRAGSVVVQIEVVGRASQPFTDGPCNGLAQIQAWLTSLGVPPVWAGTPDRSIANWAKGGHFGHMDVPENSHTDPGNVNKTKLTALPTIEDDMFTDTDRSMLITAYHLLQEQQLRNAPVVAAAVAGIPALTAKAVVAALPAGGTPGVVDVAAIAKAVNDDAAKRLVT